MQRLLVILGVLFSTRAQAQDVTVAIDPDLAQQAGVDPTEVEQQIHDATSGQLKLDEPQAFLEQMAAANAFATKGMGVDYATNPQRFFVGGAFGTAVNGAGFTFVRGEETLPTGGFALQASANAGLNLGFMSKDESFLRRIVVSANGLWYAGAAPPFEAEFFNLGGHIQLKLIRPSHKGVVEWGGLDVTSGYELSSYRLSLSESLPVETTGLRWDASGDLDITASSGSIPIELSTNLRVFVVSAYIGGALDIRTAAVANGTMSLGGPLTFTGAGQDQPLGTVNASLALEGHATEYVPRAFAGVQVNIVWLKVYGHVNVGFDDTYAGHLGVRVAL